MIEQILIGSLGATTIYLTQDPRPAWRRAACLFGLAAQPAWFYATITAQQWGMVAVCVLYTLGWMRGVWHHWLKPGAA